MMLDLNVEQKCFENILPLLRFSLPWARLSPGHLLHPRLHLRPRPFRSVPKRLASSAVAEQNAPRIPFRHLHSPTILNSIALGHQRTLSTQSCYKPRPPASSVFLRPCTADAAVPHAKSTACNSCCEDRVGDA